MYITLVQVCQEVHQNYVIQGNHFDWQATLRHSLHCKQFLCGKM